jgi:hypothetical protein
MQVRGYLQDVVSDRFGARAWQAFNAAPTAIAVASVPGRWASSHNPTVNLLMKTRSGWIGHRSGSAAAVSRETAQELDRLLAAGQLWSEPGRHPEVSCPDSGADAIMIRHAGRSKTVYQSPSCGRPNFSTRLIRTALDERLP